MDTRKPYQKPSPPVTHNGKRYPHRVGAAFPNADGTIGVVLNSLPSTGASSCVPVRQQGITGPGGDTGRGRLAANPALVRFIRWKGLAAGDLPTGKAVQDLLCGRPQTRYRQAAQVYRQASKGGAGTGAVAVLSVTLKGCGRQRPAGAASSSAAGRGRKCCAIFLIPSGISSGGEGAGVLGQFRRCSISTTGGQQVDRVRSFARGDVGPDRRRPSGHRRDWLLDAGLDLVEAMAQALADDRKEMGWSVGSPPPSSSSFTLLGTASNRPAPCRFGAAPGIFQVYSMDASREDIVHRTWSKCRRLASIAGPRRGRGQEDRGNPPAAHSADNDGHQPSGRGNRSGCLEKPRQRYRPRCRLGAQG